MMLETQDPQELWAQCLLNIERQVRPQSFSNWFRPTHVNRFDENQLVIQVPSLFFADWVENHYLGMIQSAVEEETTLVPKVSFVVAQASESDSVQTSPATTPIVVTRAEPSLPAAEKAAENTGDSGESEASPQIPEDRHQSDWRNACSTRSRCWVSIGSDGGMVISAKVTPSFSRFMATILLLSSTRSYQFR